MSYFARDDTTRRQSPPRRQGKYVGGPAPVPELAKPVITRDDYIAQSIASMQPKDEPAGGGVLRFVSDTQMPKQPTRNKNHKADNDIFGPPVLAPTPRMRVRIGVTDEELSKIWAEDDRKAKAQSRMEQGSTLVEKMVAQPVNPVIPSGKSKDHGPPPRKIVHNLSETMEERNRQVHEPMGFAGMGANCRDSGRQGRMCKPAEEFIPPELKMKPRNEGRRTRFPKDTFSFQEDIQTY